MGKVACVVEGCEYSADSVESVEAHISGSTRDEHSGKLGRNHRQELVEEAEGSSEAAGNLAVGLGEAADSGGSSDAKFPASTALVVATLLLVVSAVAGAEDGGAEEIVEPEQRGGVA